ncbi:MAG: hypothetical protein ACKVQS_12485 [Fimbriimonadaceae bacterium]
MLRILPLALLIIGSSGCQDPTPNWVGEYRGENKDLVSEQIAEENPILASQIRLVILELKSDRTFVLSRGGMPTQGTYTLAKNEATLTITKILNQPIENQSEMVKKQNVPIHLTRNKDGSITIVDPADFGRKPITLKPSSNKN